MTVFPFDQHEVVLVRVLSGSKNLLLNLLPQKKKISHSYTYWTLFGDVQLCQDPQGVDHKTRFKGKWCLQGRVWEWEVAVGNTSYGEVSEKGKRANQWCDAESLHLAPSETLMSYLLLKLKFLEPHCPAKGIPRIKHTRTRCQWLCQEEQDQARKIDLNPETTNSSGLHS